MSQLSAETDGIRAMGTQAALLGTQLLEGALPNPAGVATALAPGFGLIGAPFLAAYAAAQVQHSVSTLTLAHRYGQAHASAQATATAYDTVENATTNQLRAEAL